MEALVQSLNVAPSTRAISNNNDEVESTFDATTWGSSGGFGNLNAKGHVKGMAFPRVSNVSRSHVYVPELDSHLTLDSSRSHRSSSATLPIR